jgi:hypothetical protein
MYWKDNFGASSSKTSIPFQLLRRMGERNVLEKVNAGYFTSDNKPGGIENSTHTSFPKKASY